MACFPILIWSSIFHLKVIEECFTFFVVVVHFVYKTVSNEWSVMLWGHVWSSFASNCFKLILVEEETSDQNLDYSKNEPKAKL